jgi:hypothetical protein
MRTHSIRSVGPLALVLLVGWVTVAAAQDHEPTVPKIEIGGHLMGILWGPYYSPGVGMRLTTALGRRAAFEVEVDSTGASREVPHADEVRWIYALQTRIMLGSVGRTTVFATFGGSGWADRKSREAEQIVQPDGTIVRRMRWKTSFAPPVLPTVGIGARHVVARYAAVRVDAQVMIGGFGDLRPVTGRLAAGVSVPLGGYRR